MAAASPGSVRTSSCTCPGSSTSAATTVAGWHPCYLSGERAFTCDGKPMEPGAAGVARTIPTAAGKDD